MSTVETSIDDAPADATPDQQATPATAESGTQPRTRRRDRAFRGAAVVFLAIFVAGAGAGVWSMCEHHTATRNAAQDRRLLQFSMDSVAQLISTDSADPQGYVDRVSATATGPWRQEFDARERSVIDTMQASHGVTTGHSVAAGIERRNDDGSVTVLVAATAETTVAVAPANPAQPAGPASPAASAGADVPPSGMQVKTDPKQYQLRVDVAEVGGQFKLSKVAFVQ